MVDFYKPVENHGWRHLHGGDDEIPGILTLVPVTSGRDVDTPMAGDILVGSSAPPGMGFLPIGAAGSVLWTDGTPAAQPIAWTISPRVAGYLRVGSASAPTNTTAGDATVIRLLVGNAALTAGVVAQVTGNMTASGYLRIGSVAAPTNTTAGDITAIRVLAGDAALAAGVVLAAAGNQTVTGYIRAGSATAPTNTTAGDATVVRLKVGDGAFGTGVEFSVTGDGALSGFLRVGSETAPTNTTAGDLTVVRLNVGNIAFTTGAEAQVGGDAEITGWLHVGAAGAPTNTTAGDTTVTRLKVVDGAFGTGVEFSVTGDGALSGFLRVGSETAPTNTTAGDLTFVRGFATTVDASTGYRIGGGATSGNYLRGNGTNFVSSAILAADLPSSFSGLANPTASVGLAIVNGAATTAMRSDGAPALDQGILPTWTGVHLASAAYRNSTYINIGSTSAPSNVTAGDITGIRLHLGTDAAFQTDFAPSLEINVGRGRITGTIASATANDSFLRVDGTWSSTASGVQGITAIVTYQPSANITTVFGMLGIAKAAPPVGVTIASMYGGYYRNDYNNVAGAVTTGAALVAAPPTISGALKPATQYGVFIDNQGAAGITTAVGLLIIKPTAATNNYYASFDTANAAALGAYQGKLAVVVAGAAVFIPYYL